ncbi:MAG: MBL fold metallo-hydrolase [Pseudomonadota bacterium]
MKIKVWGCRGSIPVSGKEFLKYGGDTTCIEIRSKNNDLIIIDAGSGIRPLGNLISGDDLKAISILFTHAHLDHVLGFPFFKPIYNEKATLCIYGCVTSQDSIRKIISKTMSPPTFPIKFDDIRAAVKFKSACCNIFNIGPIEITPINLSHPNGGTGFKFTEDGKSFVFLTDNELTYTHPTGLSFEEYTKFCRNADVLFHDSEYNKEEYSYTKTWGHTVYTDSLNLAIKANVKNFGLFHHNQNRNDAQVQEIENDCKQIIKDKKSNLNCYAVFQGMEIQI